jgi:small-conductance mechanosensitive channel
VVPNSFFLEKSVLNWSYENNTVRTQVQFGVSYATQAKQFENICMDIMLNHQHILQNPMPIVVFDAFSDSNLDFQLLFWCDLSQINSLAEIRSEIRFKIDEKFRYHKIEMAYPQRDLNLKVSAPVPVTFLNKIPMKE